MFFGSMSTAFLWPMFWSPARDPVIGDRAYGTEPGKVAAIAGAIARGPAGGRRPAGAQAPAGPWPRDGRQPSQAAGGRYRPGHPGSHRFCRVPAARRPAARHDRTCCVFRHRPRRTGHHFGHNGARSDSRVYWVPGPADERRRLDEGAVRHDRGAQPRRVCRRLRRRAPLQRRPGRNDRGRAAQAPTLAGEAAKRAEAALAQRKAPEEFDVDAARKIFTQMVDAEQPSSQRKTGS